MLLPWDVQAQGDCYGLTCVRLDTDTLFLEFVRRNILINMYRSQGRFLRCVCSPYVPCMQKTDALCHVVAICHMYLGLKSNRFFNSFCNGALFYQVFGLHANVLLVFGIGPQNKQRVCDSQFLSDQMLSCV
jgi:hypothetical protein